MGSGVLTAIAAARRAKRGEDAGVTVTGDARASGHPGLAEPLRFGLSVRPRAQRASATPGWSLRDIIEVGERDGTPRWTKTASTPW